MSFDKSWEEDKYLKIKQTGSYPYEKANRYPYDLLVSIVARKFFKIPKGKRIEIKALDLGCGTGNNAKFLAENGFDIYGIDCSKSAVEICQETFLNNNLKGSFVTGDFLNLPYENNFFDLAIDRESLCANKFDDIKKIVQEVYSKLKNGGFFVSFMYSSHHPIKKLGEMIEANTFDNFKEGSSFYKRGMIHFSTIDEIYDLYSSFKIENIMRHSLDMVHGDSNLSEGFDEYIIISKKQ